VSGRLFKIQDWEALAREAAFQPAEMASLVPISQRQLQRFFLQHFHTTPSLWLRELQCRKARQLISEGFSTKAVAVQLKFASESHFCREFKKQFGSSPQTFAPTHIPKY
jgi:transcriptional regulator GlxA family with amidase domain